MPDSPPQLVGGRYRLADELGRGGMGVVWRARDEILDRAVALKQVLLPDWVSGKERERAFERVLREARSAARLRHAGVVTIHDVVLDEGYPWIVMELLPAESLHEVVDRWGPLTEEVAVEIGVKLLDALQAAHNAGITHRDVKPGNVLLLDDGGVVLTDFGVAHVADSPTITGTGMLLGSPAFMAPERLEGKPATAASDLWALGATLYNAVEGAPPYRGPTPVAVLAAILMSEPRPPQRAGRLRPVIEGLMARDPADRMSHGAARAALIRAGGHPERTGSRALADLVRQADEAEAGLAGRPGTTPGSRTSRPAQSRAPGEKARGEGASAGRPSPGERPSVGEWHSSSEQSAIEQSSSGRPSSGRPSSGQRSSGQPSSGQSSSGQPSSGDRSPGERSSVGRALSGEGASGERSSRVADTPGLFPALSRSEPPSAIPPTRVSPETGAVRPEPSRADAARPGDPQAADHLPAGKTRSEDSRAGEVSRPTLVLRPEALQRAGGGNPEAARSKGSGRPAGLGDTAEGPSVRPTPPATTTDKVRGVVAGVAAATVIAGLAAHVASKVTDRLVGRSMVDFPPEVALLLILAGLLVTVLAVPARLLARSRTGAMAVRLSLVPTLYGATGQALPYVAGLLAVWTAVVAVRTWQNAAKPVAVTLIGAAAGFAVSGLLAADVGPDELLSKTFTGGALLTVPWLIRAARRTRPRP
ncbi:protein kinase [Nonomuraea sp. NPDC050328]|uniref:serine/threonine-protein kinase n=1 Tax=Nonomuraea sp. NPDC050328 TaxID=3364361 RepID=UPI0037AD6695